MFFLSTLFALTNKPQFFFSGLLSALPNKSTLSSQFKLRALGNQQNLEIYKAQIGIKRKILGFITVNTYLINQSFSSGSKLPLDSSPGGVYDVSTFINLGDLPTYFRTNLLENAFCFVPTVSWLDLSSSFSNFSYSDLIFPYHQENMSSYPKSTPFSAVKTGYHDNESHIDFTLLNARWFYSKIENTTLSPACASFCSQNFVISGSSNICTSETYQVLNLPSGSTVTWSASPSGQVSINTSGNSATITKIYDANVTITATVTTACGNTEVSRVITVGNPTYPPGQMMVFGDENPSMSSYYSYNMPDYPGAISYDWYVWGGYGAGPSVYPYYPSHSVDVVFNSPGYYSILAKVTTACGEIWMDNQQLNVYVDNSGYRMQSAYSYSPNPADDVLTISYNYTGNDSKDPRPCKNKTIKKEDKNFEIKLLNNSGKILVSERNKKGENSIRITTKHIPDGTYYLHILDGKELLKNQIIIQH